MKNYLFAALLGCFVVSGLAQQRDESYSFTDSQGRCWVCRPNAPCVPCTSNLPGGPGANAWIPGWDVTCPVPDCTNPELRGTLFPLADPRNFHQCASNAGVWAAVKMDCQCGTFFDFEMQRCEFPWDWIPHCSTLIIPIPTPVPCEDELPPAETPPTVPDETTVAGDTTAAPPCNCIPWIPCWCNPCMQMPCGQCGGCGASGGGMMGGGMMGGGMMGMPGMGFPGMMG